MQSVHHRAGCLGVCRGRPVTFGSCTLVSRGCWGLGSRGGWHGLGLAPAGAEPGVGGGDTNGPDRPHSSAPPAVLRAIPGDSCCRRGRAGPQTPPHGWGRSCTQVLSAQIIRTERKGRTIMLGQITAPPGIFLVTVTPGRADQVMGSLGVFKMLQRTYNCTDFKIRPNFSLMQVLLSARRLQKACKGVCAGLAPDSSQNHVRWDPRLHFRLASLEPGSAPASARPEPRLCPPDGAQGQAFRWSPLLPGAPLPATRQPRLDPSAVVDTPTLTLQFLWAIIPSVLLTKN